MMGREEPEGWLAQGYLSGYARTETPPEIRPWMWEPVPG